MCVVVFGYYEKMEKDIVRCCVHLICISVFGLYEIVLVRDIETIEKGRIVCSILEDDTTKIKEVYLLALLSHYWWHC